MIGQTGPVGPLFIRNFLLHCLKKYANIHYVTASGGYICGSSSVVERRLAKAKVAGPNPVFRSILTGLDMGSVFSHCLL